MALAQNLLDFIPGYSFCDINRVSAYQNRAESSPKGRMQVKTGETTFFAVRLMELPFLKKRRRIQSHDAD